MKTLANLALSLLWIGAFGPRMAHAQSECAGGRVQVEGGYCCWPGQRFDPATSHCSGAPRCPSGTTASGADCVARDGEPDHEEASPHRDTDWGLVGAGIALTTTGYLGAAITSIVMGQQTSNSPVGGVRVQPVPNWYLGLIPVFHALGALESCCGSYDIPMIIAGIGGALLEAGGVVLIIVGALGNEASEASVRAGPFELLPYAPLSDAGLSVRATF